MRPMVGSRGGHSNRLCTNTRDRGQELQAVKAENLEGQAVKGTSQIRKSQGSSTVKVNRIQNLIKARYHTFNSVKSMDYLSDGQGPKLRSKFLTARVYWSDLPLSVLRKERDAVLLILLK